MFVGRVESSRPADATNGGPRRLDPPYRDRKSATPDRSERNAMLEMSSPLGRREFFGLAAGAWAGLALPPSARAEPEKVDLPITGAANRDLEPFDELMTSFVERNKVPGAACRHPPGQTGVCAWLWFRRRGEEGTRRAGRLVSDLQPVQADYLGSRSCNSLRKASCNSTTRCWAD